MTSSSIQLEPVAILWDGDEALDNVNRAILDSYKTATFVLGFAHAPFLRLPLNSKPLQLEPLH